MRHGSRNSGYVKILILVVIAIVVAIAVLLFLNRNHSAAKTAQQPADLSSYCVGQTFAQGNSGHCVRDVQTLINYMEHSGLTECPFNAGATLAASGTYDNATMAQVRSVQQWSSCYARQEGFTSNVRQTGEVDRATGRALYLWLYRPAP